MTDPNYTAYLIRFARGGPGGQSISFGYTDEERDAASGK